MGSRLRARESAALATSAHLVCRPRPDNAPVGDWADVLRELPNRVGDWMERLRGEGIRGADLVFACIGPALEIFSRYAKAETADGREVSLAGYLEKVWEVVGRSALAQVLGSGSGFQPEITGKMPVPQATTLDRVHAAMLLQAGGRTNALRALLKAEQERGADFERLANALATLYPKGSEEKRLLEAMLQAVPR